MELEPDFHTGSGSEQKVRVVGAGVFGWIRSRNFHPAPARAPTLQYLKYFGLDLTRTMTTMTMTTMTMTTMTMIMTMTTMTMTD